MTPVAAGTNSRPRCWLKLSATTSLAAETGRNFDLQSTVTALADELRKLYADYSTAPRQVFELWKQENLLIGKTVEIVDAGQRLLQGRIADIGESGEIFFETGGRTLKFYSGDIRIRKESLDGNALFSSRELKK